MFSRLPLLVLLLVPLAAHAKKPDRDLPPPPPTVSVPTDPGTERSPYADQDPAPPLRGADTQLDLEALSHVKRTFNIGVDLTPVNDVDEPGAAGMMRHLAADPRWKLVERDGAMVAFQRTSRGKEFHGSLTGYQRGPREVFMVALRFGAFDDDSEWSRSPHVTTVPASQSQLSVPTFYLPDGDWRNWSATAMTVQGPFLSLDIFEARSGSGRPNTANALSLTLPYVSAVSLEYGKIADKGFHNWYMPRKEPPTEQPSVEITTLGRGTLALAARLNPGREGWSWVRVLDDQLEPWEADAVAVGTREQVGWSSDETQVFLLQGSFPVPSGAKFTGTAEVWFQPSAGGPAERLFAAPVTVPKR